MKYHLLIFVFGHLFAGFALANPSSLDPKFVSLIPSVYEESLASGNSGIDSPNINNKITLYPEKDLKSKSLGIITSVLHTDRKDRIEMFFEGSQKIRTPFKPNLLSEFCESSEQKILFLQLCEDHTDEWCNLGSGPWGKTGWVHLEPQDVFGDLLDFTVGNFAGATIKKDEKGIYHASGFDRTKGDRLHGTVKREELLTKDGKLKATISCEPFSC